MKKFGYTFLMILAASIGIFAQSTNVKKVEEKQETSTEPYEREEFDPTRNAAADLQAAITKATKANKRIILDVGGEWCGWCQFLDYYLIKNKDLAKIVDENFVWLKVNMSLENENKKFLSKYPEIKNYPHLFVLEKDGTFLHSQDTSELKDRFSFNKQSFTEFLTKWSPAKTAKANKNAIRQRNNH